MENHRKALSPVISTVILVAVSIMVAVSASFWMSGIANTYVKNEFLEVSMRVDIIPGGWNVTAHLKNAGPDSITFTDLYLNDSPLPPLANSTGFGSLPSGGESRAYIEIPSAFSTPGTTIKVEIQTASGMKYPILVTLK